MYTSTETATMADLLPPGGGLGRERGDVHQLRAAHRPGEEGRALAGAGAGRLSHLPSGRRRLGLRRHVQGVARSGVGVPDPQGDQPRPALRHHRHRRLPHARRRGRHPVAIPRGRRPRRRRPRAGRAASVHRRALLHADGRARLYVEAPRPLPEPTSERYPSRCCSRDAAARAIGTPRRAPKSAERCKLYPREVYVEVSPVDARALWASSPMR